MCPFSRCLRECLRAYPKRAASSLFHASTIRRTEPKKKIVAPTKADQPVPEGSFWTEVTKGRKAWKPFTTQTMDPAVNDYKGVKMDIEGGGRNTYETNPPGDVPIFDLGDADDLEEGVVDVTGMAMMDMMIALFSMGS